MATGSPTTFDRLLNLLASADDKFTPLASRAVLQAEEAVKEIIQVYPPQPSRTRSKTFNTYVRGIGSFPKSAFIADADAPGGFRTRKVRRANIRYTSEQLDKRWVMYVTAKRGKAEGSLSNSASYSGYVNGFKEGEVRQVNFHQETGWVSADDAIEDAASSINAIANKAAEDFVKLFSM